MQLMVEQKRKQIAESLMQFWGVHSPVRRSRHQENGKKRAAGRDRNHDDKQLWINQKLRE